MRSPTKHQGILNMQGREPVGAVLAIGVKDKQKGFPTETDRFHLVNPRENNGVRDLHVVFNPFNTAPVEKRKIIHGNLVHATRAECFEFQLKAQVLGKAHPNRMPCCVGDGEKATRWMGGAADNFKEIVCPHDKCEFRQTKPPLCKPFMRMLFRLRWDKSNGFAQMPELLVKFTSGAWSTTSNVKGFFDYIERTAKNLGLQKYTLFGLPFMMTLAYQTKPSDKSRFPVVTITPEADPVAFFMQQRENIRLLSSPVTVVSLASGEENAVDVVYEDAKGIDGAPVSIPNKLEKSPKSPIEQKTGKSATSEKEAAEKVSQRAAGEAPDGKSDATPEYEPPKVKVPADWGTKWRKQDAFGGKTWEQMSATELETTMRTNENEKFRKGAYCEIEYRKQLDEPPYPDNWGELRKTDKGKGCSVPYKDCGAKVLENLRKDGDMSAVYEMRFKIDQNGEPIPSDDKLFTVLQNLMSKK